jgi:hypothetical protein
MRKMILAAFLTLPACPALANDTMAVLKTGGLEFVQTTDISMEEENLYISPKEVRVDYVFRNTGDKPLDTLVAFPMPDISGGPEQNVDAGNPDSDNFLNFSVTQDGKKITPALQQRVIATEIDMTDIVRAAKVPLLPLSNATFAALEKLPADTVADWKARGLVMADSYDNGAGMKDHLTPLWTLKSVYWWRTTFPAGQEIHVSHHYHPSVGGTVAVSFLQDGKPEGDRFKQYQAKYCMDDGFVRKAIQSNADMNDGKPYYTEQWISYILTTGANWFGPIKKFTLTVDKGEPDSIVSFCGDGVKKTGPTTFEMTKTDFYPDKDLDILLLVPTQAP